MLYPGHLYPDHFGKPAPGLANTQQQETEAEGEQTSQGDSVGKEDIFKKVAPRIWNQAIAHGLLCSLSSLSISSLMFSLF